MKQSNKRFNKLTLEEIQHRDIYSEGLVKIIYNRFTPENNKQINL